VGGSRPFTSKPPYLIPAQGLEGGPLLIFFAWSGDGVFIHANSALLFFVHLCLKFIPSFEAIFYSLFMDLKQFFVFECWTRNFE
jgi:hypothetical protein